MTATNHALTGAAIATIVRQPILALPLAFLSHLACDALPHFGVQTKNFFGGRAMYTWLAVDGLTALSFAALLLSLGVNNPLFLSVGAFFAMAPDFSWLYYGLKKRTLNNSKNLHRHDYFNKLHSQIQWYQKPPGLLVEVAWAGLMTFVILKLQ